MTTWLADYPNNIWDMLSISLLIAALTENLPQITALLTLVWVAIRISETCTVRALTRRIFFRKRIDLAYCIMKMGEQ